MHFRPSRHRLIAGTRSTMPRGDHIQCLEVRFSLSYVSVASPNSIKHTRERTSEFGESLRRPLRPQAPRTTSENLCALMTPSGRW